MEQQERDQQHKRDLQEAVARGESLFLRLYTGLSGAPYMEQTDDPERLFSRSEMTLGTLNKYQRSLNELIEKQTAEMNELYPLAIEARKKRDEEEKKLCQK